MIPFIVINFMINFRCDVIFSATPTATTPLSSDFSSCTCCAMKKHLIFSNSSLGYT